MPDPVIADKLRWQVFGLEQTGQLDKANGKVGDVLAIYDTCEAREAEVRKALAPRSFWQQLTPWRE